MTKLTNLINDIENKLSELFNSVTLACDEVTIVSNSHCAKKLLQNLRDIFACDQLIDLCAVDYLLYGVYDWETDSSTSSGFERAVSQQQQKINTSIPERFAVVYHLLSTTHNFRLRVKVFFHADIISIESVHDLWPVANWFEREAYDLYGILFINHPDLRRILTDYGFIGYPFRKDFPVSGNVEMRYDATLQKVIYEAIDLEPRTSVPKVIRHDNRYMN